MNEKIWTVEDAAKILEMPIPMVYKRASQLRMTIKGRGGNRKERLNLLYSDQDIQAIREWTDRRRKVK